MIPEIVVLFAAAGYLWVNRRKILVDLKGKGGENR